MKTNLSKTSRPLLHCLLPLLLLSLAVAPSQAQTSTSLDPEFYNTLCRVAEQLSAKVAEHGYAPTAL